MTVLVARYPCAEQIDELRPLGAGPTRLISPRTTFSNWGSSSIEVRRMRRPTAVRLSVPSTPPGA
jgi:hypothetical protein